MTSNTQPDSSRVSRFERDALALRDELGRAARRYTANAHDAEDLVQETYIRAWAGFDSFQPGSNLRAWMFRIMVNTWISAHRRSERRPRETLTDSITDAQLMAESGRRHTAPSAEAQALQWLPNDDLAQAFQALPESLQLAVYYAYVCQLAYQEIADLEQIPVGTVMSRLHRARRQLRAALQSDADPCAA